MKKFLLSVAALALFAAPVFAQEEQEVTCEFYGSFDSEQYPDKVWDMGGQEVEGINYDSKQIKPITCELELVGENTYALKHAFGSDNTMTFTFNPAEADEDGWAPISYVLPGWNDEEGDDSENNKEVFNKYFIKFKGSDYRMYNINETRWDVAGTDGTTYSMNDICFRYAWPTPMVKIEDGWYEVYIYIWAEYNDGNWGWLTDHWMIFTFDEFEGEGGDDSAVANVEVEENAPAVYYNLQGQKVENPSNGVYIVRQGKTAKKVMVK